MDLFRKLNEKEQEEFRAAARKDFYLGIEIKTSIWHPVYCDELAKLNLKIEHKI